MKKNFLFKTLTSLVMIGLMSSLAYAKSEKISEEELTAIRDAQVATQQKVAEAMNAMNQIRQEFSSMKGAIDENTYLNNDQKTQIESLEQEMRTLQDRLHLLSLEMNDLIQGKVKPALADKQKAEADAYLLGLDAFNADKITAARDTFQGFLQKYPKSRWRPNALYWIGETYFRVEEYPKAIEAYQSVVGTGVASPWAKQAIFKQGVAFFELKDYESAGAFFAKVMGDYPKTSEAWRAQEYQKKTQEILKAQAAAQALPR